MSRSVFFIFATTLFALARGGAIAADTAPVPERPPGWLNPTYYDRRQLPPAIRDENARRFARYLGDLNTREEQRLAAYRRWTADRPAGDPGSVAAVARHLTPMRERLAESLGVHGPSATFQIRDTRSWRWMGPIRTTMAEVEGERTPRNVAQRRGTFEEVSLSSRVGELSALLVKARALAPPYRVVVCVPDVDSHTGLADRKENLVGAPHIRKFTDAGFLVVAVDLAALTDLRESAVKKAFLLGEPPLGRLAAQLSVVVSYLRTRDDVQADRIALHGRGLGGFAVALSAAVDPRVWATVVEDGLRSYRRTAENGAELDVPWLVPRMLSYADGADLVALIAPRPLLLIENGTVSPPWSTVATARLVADSFYPFHGADENFIGVGATAPRDASTVVTFLQRHLRAPSQAWEKTLAPSPAPAPEEPAKPVSISDVRSAAGWVDARARILAEVKALLGGLPERGADHSGQVIERGREDGFTWERVFVRTTPETLTPILITRSDRIRTPAPALIHISGSSISHEDDALKLAGEMAGHGFIGVFACLKSATNFRLGGTPRDALGIVEGRPILGEWAWNLMGLVDYLESRPEIDRHRIGAMGWSLGATTVTYLLPFDERIRAGAGFVAFFQLKGMWDAVQTPEIIGGETGVPFLERHQINSFVPGLLRICDVDDLLATMAPRPLLSLAGERDEYFPIASVRDAFERQHRLYTLLGVPERVELLTYPGPHAMAPPLREKAWEFFGRWLR